MQSLLIILFIFLELLLFVKYIYNKLFFFFTVNVILSTQETLRLNNIDDIQFALIKYIFIKKEDFVKTKYKIKLENIKLYFSILYYIGIIILSYNIYTV